MDRGEGAARAAGRGEGADPEVPRADPAGLRVDPEEAGVREGLAAPEEDLPARAVQAPGLPARAAPGATVPSVLSVLTVPSVPAVRPGRGKARPAMTRGVRAGPPATSNAPAGFSKAGSPSPRLLLQCRRWYQ